MQSVVEKSYTLPKLLVFPSGRNMVAPAEAPLQADQTKTRYSPQKHGNLAQWVAPFISFIMLIIVVCFHYADSAAKSSDEHVNSLIDTKIDTKLNPAMEKVSTHLDKVNAQLDTKIDAVIGKIGILSDRVSRLEGARGIVDIPALRKQFNKVIAETRSALDSEKPGEPIDIRKQMQAIAATLVNVKIPADAVNEGVSALVHVAAFNYFTQAFPSHPPDLIIHNSIMAGNKEGIHIEGSVSVIADNVTIRDSAQDLSGIYWIHATFENTEIRYSGGPLFLADTTFKNCTFKFGDDPRSQEVRAALLGLTKRNMAVSMLLANDFSSLRLHPDRSRPQ
jgi:hypothetical protein